MAGSIGSAVLVGLSLSQIQASKAAAISGWGGFANARIPTSELTAIGDGMFLRSDAAAALGALRAAYAATFGAALPVNSAYRDWNYQAYLYDQSQHGGNLASPPGKSNHGWALAVDFGGPIYQHKNPQFAWMEANAGVFGWVWAGALFSQVEYWHWEYSGSYAGPSSPPVLPIHPGRMYPEMRSIRDPRDERWWAIGNGDPQPFGDNTASGGTYYNASVLAFQVVWGPGDSSLSTQSFLDTILASTPVSSPIRPAVALGASDATRAAAAQSILNQAMVLYTT
jgi:hypothetical protein